MKFPDGFLWGAATAAHQVEGGNVNSDYWLLEHITPRLFSEPSGDACDHYHRYGEDLGLLARLGFNSYRFSIEWARIEPAEGEFSIAALDHYRRMLAACHEHRLTPVVTFHHFTSPLWIAAQGGWESPDTADKFARYCERAVRHLGDLIGVACTINELNLANALQQGGVMPSDEKIANSPWRREAARRLGIEPRSFSAFPFAVQSNAREVTLKAHRLAVDALRSGPGKFPVGMTVALQDLQAVAGGERSRDRAQAESQDIFFEAARGDDFVGVQTYSRHRFGPEGPIGPEPGVELTQMGYEFWPQSLEATIRYAASKAQVPVIVTESGISASDDTRRVAYVEQALQGVGRCLRDGIDVRGYFYWSLLDNFEWIFGYMPTFGIIGVDRATQRRIVKPSAEWLGRIARANEM